MNSINNTYLNKKAVDSYKDAANIPAHVFDEITDVILNNLKVTTFNHLDILDIGIGTGSFCFPILERLKLKGFDFLLKGFDISDHMLNILNINMLEQNSLKRSIAIENYDANNGIPKVFYKENNYHIVLMTFMIHYIARWKNLIKCVNYVLKDNGLLILSETCGALRIIDGTFDLTTGLDDTFYDFWYIYFKQRAEIAKWDPKITVSNIRIVNDYLKKETDLRKVELKDFFYFKELSYKDMIMWIQTGVFSSVNSGLREDNKDNLAKYMTKWVEKNKIDIEKKNEYKMGITFYIYR